MKSVTMRQHKYRAKPTRVDGITFASRLEAKVYKDTRLLLRSGEASVVEPQKRFPLTGRNLNPICVHIVDFLITFKDGHQEVWEAKGYPTEVWKLKRKLFEDNYPGIKYVVHTNNRKLQGGQHETDRRRSRRIV